MITQFAAKGENNIIKANSLRLGNYGVIIFGGSGSGKSQLTLSLIERAALFGYNACLVADDYTQLTSGNNNAILANSPPSIVGKMEIRGAGIYQFPYEENVALNLALHLEGEGERYPSGHVWHWCDKNTNKNLSLPLLKLPEVKKTDILTLCHAIEAWLFKEKQ